MIEQKALAATSILTQDTALRLSNSVEFTDPCDLANDRESVVQEDLRALSPLANQIVEKAIDNLNRKLIAGYRNKDNAKPNAKNIDPLAEGKEVLAAVSAESVMQVANRGQAWKELILKSVTAGISSIATIKFDGGFKVVAGQPSEEFSTLPKSPGVYVVFDSCGDPVYIGDSENMKMRWHAGHLNELRHGELSGKPYKLAPELLDGCEVKFIKMETKESAAALEAHLIRESFTRKPEDGATAPPQKQSKLKNKREELATEQGTRSNQEAKKLKDASESTASLAKGAAGEAVTNVGYDLFSQLSTATIKGVKDEMVDIFRGGKAKIAARIKRLLIKVLKVLKGVIDNPLQILRGIVEFIVNALSKAIGQVYNLARNLFDIVNGAVNFYRGAETMSREELVRKISETVIVTGSLVVWDALDPVIEGQLAFLGPFAPYVSAAVVAVGFGLSSYALQAIVTKVIDTVVAFRRGVLESVEASRALCKRMIDAAEKELELMSDLKGYIASSLEFMEETKQHTARLATHQVIEPFIVQSFRHRAS